MNNPNQLSFLPEDYLERKAQTRTNVICASLLLMVMGAAGVAYYLTQESGEQIELDHAALTAEYDLAAKRINQVQKMQSQQKKLSRQAELTASLLEKIPRSLVLADITRALPPGASLLDFEMTSKKKVKKVEPTKRTRLQRGRKKVAAKPEQEEPPEYNVTMKLTGMASTDVEVSKFIAGLNKVDMFRDVNLKFSEEHEDGAEMLRKFELELTLDESVELPDQPAIGAITGSKR